ncbi:MAG: hypothetical protein WAK26_15240 [Terracidiphilus sp.]
MMLLLLCSTLAQAKDKPTPADYNIKVHISATHMLPTCDGPGCGFLLYASAVLNGKKVELAGVNVIIEKTYSLIRPGDYSLKLTKDIHNQDSSVFLQSYDLLLSDGLVWHCYTSGISE